MHHTHRQLTHRHTDTHTTQPHHTQIHTHHSQTHTYSSHTHRHINTYTTHTDSSHTHRYTYTHTTQPHHTQIHTHHIHTHTHHTDIQTHTPHTQLTYTQIHAHTQRETHAHRHTTHMQVHTPHTDIQTHITHTSHHANTTYTYTHRHRHPTSSAALPHPAQHLLPALNSAISRRFLQAGSEPAAPPHTLAALPAGSTEKTHDRPQEPSSGACSAKLKDQIPFPPNDEKVNTSKFENLSMPSNWYASGHTLKINQGKGNIRCGLGSDTAR